MPVLLSIPGKSVSPGLPDHVTGHVCIKLVRLARRNTTIGLG
jgi:hypothetical protein